MVFILVQPIIATEARKYAAPGEDVVSVVIQCGPIGRFYKNRGEKRAKKRTRGGKAKPTSPRRRVSRSGAAFFCDDECDDDDDGEDIDDEDDEDGDDDEAEKADDDEEYVVGQPLGGSDDDRDAPTDDGDDGDDGDDDQSAKDDDADGEDGAVKDDDEEDPGAARLREACAVLAAARKRGSAATKRAAPDAPTVDDEDPPTRRACKSVEPAPTPGMMSDALAQASQLLGVPELRDSVQFSAAREGKPFDIRGKFPSTFPGCRFAIRVDEAELDAYLAAAPDPTAHTLLPDQMLNKQPPVRAVAASGMVICDWTADGRHDAVKLTCDTMNTVFEGTPYYKTAGAKLRKDSGMGPTKKALFLEDVVGTIQNKTAQRIFISALWTAADNAIASVVGCATYHNIRSHGCDERAEFVRVLDKQPLLLLFTEAGNSKLYGLNVRDIVPSDLLRLHASARELIDAACPSQALIEMAFSAYRKANGFANACGFTEVPIRGACDRDGTVHSQEDTDAALALLHRLQVTVPLGECFVLSEFYKSEKNCAEALVAHHRTARFSKTKVDVRPGPPVPVEPPRPRCFGRDISKMLNMLGSGGVAATTTVAAPPPPPPPATAAPPPARREMATVRLPRVAPA
ncbi:MAG: hypothetical protein WC732_09930, partial [Candidatus Omnitrophota bacterium]